jgi:hypothetical protein
MDSFFAPLILLIGMPVVIIVAVSPFLMVWYQNKRNSFFKQMAEKYNLQYTQNYPYKTFLYHTILSDPPKTSRLIEGVINSNKVLIGDYIASQYWYPGFFHYITSGGKTMIFLNDKEQKVSTPFFWGFVTKHEIDSFLDSISSQRK